MSVASQIVAALLEADEENFDAKEWLMQQPFEGHPAEQIGGDFGDPWVYGGAWKRHDDDVIWYTPGLEGEDIKDVEPWDIEVTPEIEAHFVQQVLPDTPYRTLKEVADVMDPDDPGRYLYQDEEREIEGLLDEWKTERAEEKNNAVSLPVYRFTDEIEDWMDMDAVRAQFDEETWEEMSTAAKVLEWGSYYGLEELDHYPDRYTKAELKKVLNLRDL